MEKNLKNKIIVILGPTSSGKSDVAIKLAKKFNGEIISADSRQIYRGLDIGTGKIHGAWNIKHKTFISKQILHYLIDIVNPNGNYNVSHFKKDAQILIADILKRGKLPIICGGTGFWIKAVVDNVNFPEVKPNWMLRNKLNNKSPEKLFKMLEKLDPERAKTIDQFNKVRLIRAIEICKAIGKVPTPPSTPSPYQGEGWGEVDFLQIGISLPKEKLYSNIKKRLQKRFKSGMIEEVVKLKKSGLSWKKIQSFGLGYFWIPQYLKGNIKNKKELFEKIYQVEKDYAKRQMTWFKKDQRIKWLKNHQEIEKETKNFLSK
jgi:tRNA dimethylallyltransferase